MKVESSNFDEIDEKSWNPFKEIFNQSIDIVTNLFKNKSDERLPPQKDNKNQIDESRTIYV